MAKPVRTPEISELRAFCAAADLGSLGRAAVALRISQPALSKRVRALEALAGSKLLERSRSGVTLTSAGRKLYGEARKLLDQADAVEAMMEGAQGAMQPLRLAVSHTIAEHYLSPELVTYHSGTEGHPAVELTVANSATVRWMVIHGRADAGIVAVDPGGSSRDGLEELDLVADEIVIAVPQDHDWYRRETIPLEDLARTPLIVRDPAAHSRRLLETTLEEHGQNLAPPLAEVGSTAAGKREAIERSAPVTVSLLALDEKRDRLYARRIEGVELKRRFAVVTRSLEGLRPQDREFLEFLRRRSQG